MKSQVLHTVWCNGFLWGCRRNSRAWKRGWLCTSGRVTRMALGMRRTFQLRLSQQNNMADSRTRLRRSAKASIPPQLGFIIGRVCSKIKITPTSSTWLDLTLWETSIDMTRRSSLNEMWKVPSFILVLTPGQVWFEVSWFVCVICIFSMISEMCRREIREDGENREGERRNWARVHLCLFFFTKGFYLHFIISTPVRSSPRVGTESAFQIFMSPPEIFYYFPPIPVRPPTVIFADFVNTQTYAWSSIEQG